MKKSKIFKSNDVITIKPIQGFVNIDVKEIWRYRELLITLTWRDIKVRYKQTLISRIKARTRRRYKAVSIISRRTQPQWRIRVKVPRLDRKVFLGGKVASSWIAALAWDPRTSEALMYLIDGHLYAYKMKFKIYRGWYYAHSKGTYFWYKNIRNEKKYPMRKLV